MEDIIATFHPEFRDRLSKHEKHVILQLTDRFNNQLLCLWLQHSETFGSILTERHEMTQTSNTIQKDQNTYNQNMNETCCDKDMRK